MKIKPAAADPDAVPHGMKGVQVRDTRWGWIAQKRPGPPKKPPTKLQQQYRTRFSFAARMAANPIDLDLLTAIEMAKGTQQVPRDILTMAALGRYYEIVNADGSTWAHVDGPTYTPPDAGPGPGEEEPPPPPEFEMQWSLWDAAWTASYHAGTYSWKGTALTPRAAMNVTHLATILNGTAGGTYQAAIADISGTGTIQAIAMSEPITLDRSGQQVILWQLAHALTPGQLTAVLVGRTDAGDTHALPIYWSATPKWLWPCTPSNAYRAKTSDLVLGGTVTNTFGSATIPVGLRLIEE